MKKIKKFVVGIGILISLIAGAIIYLAANPELTEELSKKLYGTDTQKGWISMKEPTSSEEEESEEESVSEEPETKETLERPVTDQPDFDVWIDDPVISSEPVEDQKVTVIDVMTERPVGKVPVYEQPLIEKLQTPSNVSSKNGYVPIEEDGTEIKEGELAGLQEKEGAGLSGKGYSFDAAIYPFYGMLSADQKTLYKQIYANALATNPSFLPLVSLKMRDVKNTFEAVYNDHPELFWVETSFSCKYVSSGECVQIVLKYNDLAKKLEDNRTQFYNRLNAVVSNVSGAGDSYEQEKMVHDLLLQMVTYDAAAPNNQSAYSALVDGKTVCAGYARAFQMIMQRLGYKCYYCTGYSGENHAWNILELYGEYYNVDVTWDDTEPGTYDYFNKSDAEFNTTHARRDLSVNLPACTGTTYSGLETSSPQTDSIQPSTTDPIYTIIGNYDDIPEDLKDYYLNCYTKLALSGIAKYEFDTEVSASTWKKIEEAYDSGNFRAGYMDYSVNKCGAGGCSMRVEAVLLKNGKYKLTHYVNMWK